MRKHVYIRASVAVLIILSGCTQNCFLRTFFKKQKKWKNKKKITSSYIELSAWLVSEIETSPVSKLTLVLMEIDLRQADNSRFLGVNHSWYDSQSQVRATFVTFVRHIFKVHRNKVCDKKYLDWVICFFMVTNKAALKSDRKFLMV